MVSPVPQLRVPDERIRDILTAQPPRPVDLRGEDLHDMDLRSYRLAGANLMLANLSGADLTDVSLSGAAVSGANFCDAVVTREQAWSATGWFLANWSPELINTMDLPSDHNERFGRKDFRGYVMNGRNLSGLDLAGIDLAEASLRDADLTNTTGLTARQLRGADLRLAKLPLDIADSLNAQPGVDEATKTSRNVFLTMLAACLYCWITILSTTDAGLLVGSSTLALPIVQTPIPVVAFFGAAPVMLLIIYLYLHFSLQNLWDGLATLPAFFPDGRPLHERALPWILSPIVRVYFKLLAPSCTPLARFQVRAVWLLAWWGVPFTLVAFFLRFLVRHDHPGITTLQIFVAALSVWFAVMLWSLTKDTLRGALLTPLPWRKALFARGVWVGMLSGVLAVALMALFSAGCFHGEPGGGPWRWQTAAPRLLNLVGWDAFGDLRNADLSRKPETWDGKNLDSVKAAQLQGRALKNLNARGAFGVRADFSPSLVDTDLGGADFYNADLRGAHFALANLERADFQEADLRFADFSHARMIGADFMGANVEGADFTGVDDLDPSSIELSANWFLAHFDDTQLKALEVCPPVCDHDDRLRRKDFSGIDLSGFFKSPDLSGANLQRSGLSLVDLSEADLSKADLRHASLLGTNLSGANLNGADLRGADLSKVEGLTRVQIESALIDDRTKRPSEWEAPNPFTPKK